MKLLFKYSFIFVCVLFLSSCASAPLKPPLGAIGQAIPPLDMSMPRQDVIHIVGPGETLWRISKMYDVNIDEVIKANRLESATKITMGQELLIPNAAPIRPVIPLYETDKWKYIIIHHSATDQGNAFSLYQLHLRRGFWNGLGYQFIIDNGTFGKGDGQIEISPRWIKQQDGAHCRAAGMNEQGIGICLVGNFSKEQVSEKQMESLVYLVDMLRKHYNIPKDRIMGHGQVPGAATECPGLRFPWEEFWSRLNSKE
ncbi:MAG: N-acetylmuramoyl-L-alanine amidase [Candidatus Omnitrophica bacterium]|nr:N-acetylmuramoyl-L-alanine amidase [Candidatus Omnitrophota bacterium]MDD5351970.1 N-acetylmuramoyl-L-alanine amidase [Candidatus Omnitrophota bacterium]MDD5550796.1 N-acetylmuramoyl-L-alanine amidase [Candidatus Omnitrophota bacterium]